jgi:hypothetical protein
VRELLSYNRDRGDEYALKILENTLGGQDEAVVYGKKQ